MPIDVSWRTRISIYNTFIYQTKGSSKFKNLLLFLKVLLLFVNYIYLIYIVSYSTLRFLKNLKVIDSEIFYLLYCCGDIEINPGPQKSSLTFCHLNLNGIAAHDFGKISLIQGYITDRNIGIICLPETFLNSSLNKKDDRLKIEGYNLIRSDHPSG